MLSEAGSVDPMISFLHSLIHSVRAWQGYRSVSHACPYVSSSSRVCYLLSLLLSEYLRSISLPVPVLVEDTSSSSEYGSVSPDTELKADPFSFKTRAKSCGEKDGKGIRTLFLG